MTPLSPAVARSRDIREDILRLMHTVAQANDAVCVTIRQVYSAFGTRTVPVDRNEVDAELVTLVEDGLLKRVQIATGGPMPIHGFKLTRGGRDFINAEFPWSKVDAYSGDQSPT